MFQFLETQFVHEEDSIRYAGGLNSYMGGGLNSYSAWTQLYITAPPPSQKEWWFMPLRELFMRKLCHQLVVKGNMLGEHHSKGFYYIVLLSASKIPLTLMIMNSRSSNKHLWSARWWRSIPIGQCHLITENQSGETNAWYSHWVENRRLTFVCGLMECIRFLFIIWGRKAWNWDINRMKFVCLVIFCLPSNESNLFQSKKFCPEI